MKYNNDDINESRIHENIPTPEENNLCHENPRYFICKKATKDENTNSIDDYNFNQSDNMNFFLRPRIIEDDDSIKIFNQNKEYNQKNLSINSDDADDNRYYIE